MWARPRGCCCHRGSLPGIQVHRLLVRLQPPPAADHPRSRPPVARLRGHPTGIQLLAPARWAVPILSRGRRRHVPGGREVLAARRRGDAEIRSPDGPDGEVHRTDPHDDAARWWLTESLATPGAPLAELTG